MRYSIHNYTLAMTIILDWSSPTQYLDDFNMSSSKEMKLVFFMDAMQHVSR